MVVPSSSACALSSSRSSTTGGQGLTIVNRLPPINPTFPLFSAKYLVKAQTLYRWLTALKWILPFLELACLAAGVYIARQHRRVLIGAGLGLAASMLVLGLTLAIKRTLHLNDLLGTVNAAAAAVAFDTLVRLIRQGLRSCWSWASSSP